MATPKWQPGKLYPPGSLVVPRTLPPGAQQAIVNSGFEDGDTGWGVGGGWSTTTAGAAGRAAYEGTGFATFTGSGQRSLGEFLAHACRPGQTITAQCFVRMPGSGDTAGARATLLWLDENEEIISIAPSPIIQRTGGTWRASSCTATAPAGTRFVKMAISATINSGGGYVDADGCSWNYVPPFDTGLQYKAVQPAAGYSDTAEPAWPGVLGQTVVDNEVIWEAVLLTRIVWQARSILRSGAVEPDWPDQPGAVVADNTISWEAVSRRVEDERCPNTKEVIIASSKVFAGDGDLVKYCATVNPLDWSSPDDAGYLPFGTNMYGANPVRAMGLYRGHGIFGNSQGTQVWQLSEDPQEMSFLDGFPIGTTYHKAMAPVSNDMMILTALGARSIGVAGGAVNLQADEIGMPIDPLVQEALAYAGENGIEPISTYHPGLGQYWLAFPDYPDDGQTACFVLTLNAQKGKWSRYIYPFAIECFVQHGDDLLIRAGDLVCVVDKDVSYDATVVENDGGSPGIENIDFGGTVWWPYLDFGQPGITKRLTGVDVIAAGAPSISIGYDQRNLDLFTPPYEIPADTLPGGIIPIPVAAPTFSVRIDFAPGAKWSLQAINLFLNDNRAGV